MIGCLVPATLLAQKEAGWRFWDASDGMVESYSLALGKGPDGRVWVRHGAVNAMSVLDGYALRTIPEPRLGSIEDYRAHISVQRVYGGSAQNGWTVVNGQLVQFDGSAWHVRLTQAGGQQLLAALPLAGKVLLLYADRLEEFTPGSGSIALLKRSSATSIGVFSEIAAGFEGEVFIAGTTGVGRLGPAHPGAPSHWTQCNTSAAGLRNLQHLLPGEAGEVFFSGTVRKGREQFSAAAVWEVTHGVQPKILYRDPQEGVRAWRGSDHSFWLLQGSSLFRLINGRKEPVERTGPLSGTILDVLSEPDGAFWLGSADGLAHYTPPAWRTPPQVSGLNEPFSKMIQDAKGRLWFVSSRHLVELDGTTWTIRALPSNTRDQTTQIDGLCMLSEEHLAIMAVELDKDDRMLIFDTRGGTFKKVIHPAGRSTSSFSCRPQGGLWVTTAPGLRLEIFDGRRFQTVADLSTEWSGGTPRKVLERSPGDFLIGGNAGAGILRLRHGQGHFQPFRPQDGFTESGALAMTATGSEILAAGRQDLLSYNGKRWTRLAARLMPRVARRMRDGTLWVASFTGIHRFRNGVWIANGEPDGLASDRVRNVLEDRDGRIWAGTSNGLSLYHPDADQVAPRTVLALTNNPKEVAPGGRVRIQFAGADQWKRTNPGQLLFAYRLDAESWQPFIAASQVSFEGLAAGSHHLQVRAMDRNGNAEAGADALDFVVLLPWYRNPGFLTLTVLGSLSILALLSLAGVNYRKLGNLVVQLNRSRIAAEYASRCKTEFLANMSHEIRTPMNAIMGMSQLALETPPGEEQNEFLRTVNSSAESLLGLLNDILDLSKIEAGKLGLSCVDFRLQDCLDGAVRTLRARANEKGLALTSRILAEVPEFLRGDDQRLRQVLINLIGNAIKFTAHGEVSLEAATAGGGAASGGAAGGGLHFVVRDTGPGVPAGRQTAIFRAFEQADSSTARNFGGSGLGLAISARIVEMMHGKMWLESPWKDPRTGASIPGSAFHFEAYFAPGQPPVPAATCSPAAATGPLRILLAEDNLVNQRLAVRRLNKDGHQVLLALNGEEALAIFEREPVDLILMDIQMPKMDGLEATAAIRARERSGGKRTPIIALTAHALEGFREQALDAGMDGFVTKPIQFEELRRAIGAAMVDPAGALRAD
jgi:signal transduction histidine kinase/ActR/RegA family two-component response regulator